MTTKTLAQPRRATLLELVASAWDWCEDEAAVVDHVRRLVQEGTHVLCGTFRDEPVEDL